MIRFSGSQGKSRQEVWQGTSIKKVLKTFEGFAERWNTDQDYRECMQEKQPRVRNHDKLGQSRKWTQEHPQNDATAKAGAIWESVASCSNYMWKIQPTRVNIQNLDKLTALEWRINWCSGRPLSKQEVLPRKHSEQER